MAEDNIWTSALATARFLDDQRPGGSAFTIGEAGLTTALYQIGYVQTEHRPDYVVLGETRTYSFERITKAIRLIDGGARFIATNPDSTGPSPAGPLPATGSVAALIRRATGVAPYFVGKPNPLMIRTALNRLDAHSETTTIVGDRMDTDVVAGLEAGLRTVLVLSGGPPRRLTRRASLGRRRAAPAPPGRRLCRALPGLRCPATSGARSPPPRRGPSSAGCSGRARPRSSIWPAGSSTRSSTSEG